MTSDGIKYGKSSILVNLSGSLLDNNVIKRFNHLWHYSGRLAHDGMYCAEIDQKN
jgi:hypothetical protein